jgi:hypothetical protein
MSLSFSVPPGYDDMKIKADAGGAGERLAGLCSRPASLDRPWTAVEETFVALLDAIGTKYFAPEWGRPAVLIDEADFCLLDALGAGVPQPLVDARVRGLGQLFRCLKEHFGRLHSVFITGVTLLYRRAGSTWLNGATFLSFPEDGLSRAMAPQLGFTWTQIERTFGRHLNAYCATIGMERASLQERMTELYNGFGVGEGSRDLFNTKSVLDFIRTGTLRSHFGNVPESRLCCASRVPPLCASCCRRILTAAAS